MTAKRPPMSSPAASPACVLVLYSIVEQMARTILQLKQAGIGLLLSEQNLPFAQAVADRAYVLEKGQIVWSGAMAALAGDANVRRQYLGV